MVIVCSYTNQSNECKGHVKVKTNKNYKNVAANLMDAKMMMTQRLCIASLVTLVAAC